MESDEDNQTIKSEVVCNEKQNEYIDQQTEIIREERAEEYGELSEVQAQHVAVIFENIPVWLLALNKNNTSRLYIPGYTSMSNFTLHLKRNK